MSIPKSLSSYSDEMDFIRRLLVPLLERLGFTAVRRTHGSREFGRDLVFGETDKFGHHVYHGLQAKYVDSISQKDAHGLVQDATEAFSCPFRHPTKGTEERISTFYVVNGGSIADNARELFYTKLIPNYGPNIRLLDGNDVIALDRRATLNLENTARSLPRLLEELSWNRATVIQLSNTISASNLSASRRLRDECACDYLRNPGFDPEIDRDRMTEYSDRVRRINERIAHCVVRRISNDEAQPIYQEISQASSDVLAMAEEIERAVRAALEQVRSLIDP